MKNIFVSYTYPTGAGHCVLVNFDDDFQINTIEDIRELQKSINDSFEGKITDDPKNIILVNLKWLPY